MPLARSAILPLGQNPFRIGIEIGIMDQAIHTPDLTRTTHEGMASALSRVTPGLLTRDRQMARLYRAHLLSTRLNRKKIPSLRLRRPVPRNMRLPVLPRLCRSHHYRVSHRSTRLLKCVPLIQRPPRVSPPMTSSLLKQALKLSLCPTISRHHSVTVSRHHRTQLRKYVRRKSPPNTTMRNVVAKLRKLLCRKALRLHHLSRFKRSFESLPFSRNPRRSSMKRFRLSPSQTLLPPHRS